MCPNNISSNSWSMFETNAGNPSGIASGTQRTNTTRQFCYAAHGWSRPSEKCHMFDPVSVFDLGLELGSAFADAAGALGPLFGPAQRRQQQAGEAGDDRNNHQKFDECERAPSENSHQSGPF